MLLTVTSNPTIDRTLFVPRLVPGTVHRALHVQCAAGGKGLNVARAARILGADTLVTGPLGGHTGRQVADMAAEEGLKADWYWRRRGETRNCILVNHRELDATVINEPGSVIDLQDWEDFEKHVARLSGAVDAVAISGSQPPGVAGDTLASLARRLASDSRPVYLDTSGSALAAALREPTGLCIKVNGQELLAAQDDPEPPTVGRVAAAARLLSRRGASLVVVTLGGRGAVAVTGDQAWSVIPPPVTVVSSVGSGDSFLAALLVARRRGHGIEEALAKAAACGAANATTDLPSRFPLELANSLEGRVAIEPVPD